MKHFFILLTSVILSICLFIILPGNIWSFISGRTTSILVIKTIALILCLGACILVSFRSYMKIKNIQDKELKIHVLFIGALEYIKFFMALTFMTRPSKDDIYNYNAALITYCIFLTIQILVYIAFTKGWFSEINNNETLENKTDKSKSS